MLNITREQFFEFVKKKKDTGDNLTSATQHYLEYFDKYQSTGKKTNWNWPSFCFGFLWMIYRRMYAYIFLMVGGFLVGALVLALVGYLLSLLEAFIPEAFLKFSVILLIIGAVISVYVLPGLYGDYVYLRYASKKIAKGKKTSGVNLWGVIILWIPFFLISLVAELSKTS